MPARRTARRLALLIALVAQPAYAQTLPYLHHQSWSTEDGPPQNTVHQILQTPDGYLWIATEGGLARFDGVAFRIFNHAADPAFTSDDISSLASDEEGSLWIGTADGLLRLRAGSFQRFGEPDGLPSANIRSLAILPGNTLLLLAGSTLVERRDNRFTTPPNAPAGIRAIQPSGHDGAQESGQPSSQPSAWLLTDGPPILWPSGTPAPVPPATGIAGSLTGPLWTFSGNTVRMAASPIPRTWQTGPNLPGSRIESIFIDRDRQAWVGTNDGLAVITSDGPTPIPALSGNAVLQTIQDHEGNFWIATETSGLHILRPLKFRTEPGLADRALTALIQATDGSIWAGTRTDGLRRLRNGLVDQPAPPGKLTSPIILSLAPGPHGSIWAGTPDGLNHIDADGHIRQITSADGLPDDYIQSLIAAPDGSLWVGTRQGLVHLHNECLHPRTATPCMDIITQANGLTGDLIGALLLSAQGDLWIATSGGLSRRHPDGTITTQTNLPSGIVTAITQDPSGALWIAITQKGLTRLSPDAPHPVPLPGRILGMTADTHGNLWLRNEHGIQRLSLAALNHCADAAPPCPLEPADYGLADGLPTTESSPGGSPVLTQLANGELWFTTRRGVAITDPGHLPFNPIPPPIALQQFLVDDAPVDLHHLPIAIPPGHVRYTMEFAALSFTAPSEVRYRFKLEGLDQAWTEPTTRRAATYTNLPPGAYTFRVQAMNDDGVWNETGASLAFTVVPPIYRRWWFLTLAALTALALAAALYRLRLRRLQTRFDATLLERNRVAREIHDTLAQDFVGVSLQLDIVSHLLRSQKVEAAIHQVAQARQLVTGGLADARRSIWELRANLSADTLPARLAKAVERYSAHPKVRLKITGPYHSLPPRTENEILRIAQESLANIQRHAQAAEASVHLAYGGAILTLTVEDNGQGFSLEAAQALTGHYGVSGMKERAALLNATIDIVTSPGAGTTITLSVPAPGEAA